MVILIPLAFNVARQTKKSTDTFYEEPDYEKIEVADRIGSGDAYIVGFLYGLLAGDRDLSKALTYANAVSALKNTLPGDRLFTDAEEITRMIEEHCGLTEDMEMAG